MLQSGIFSPGGEGNREEGTLSILYIYMHIFFSFGPGKKPAFFKNLRWKSWTACLVEVSGHKLEFSQNRVFV